MRIDIDLYFRKNKMERITKILYKYNCKKKKNNNNRVAINAFVQVENIFFHSVKIKIYYL